MARTGGGGGWTSFTTTTTTGAAAANTVSGVDPLVRGISGRIRIVLNIAVVGFNSFTTRHNVSPAIQLLCGNVVQSLDITITISKGPTQIVTI